MDIKKSKTECGFRLLKFKDRYDHECSIQKSSLATEDAIWMGIDDANPRILASKVTEGGTGWARYPLPDDMMLTTRMHLTRDQVAELLPILQEFAATGRLP